LVLIDRLQAQISAKKSPILVGLDPLFDRLPPALKPEKPSREAAALALYRFNEALLEAIADLVPAVKLQMACYELYGPAGLEAFERSVVKAKALGLFVIDDSKRGDIGSTAALYAAGHLGAAPLGRLSGPLAAQDFVTINPYLGSDGLDPFYKEALAQDKGVYVLVRTSNPSARQYQEAQIEGRALFEQIALDLQAQAQAHQGSCGYAPFGAVVGATWPAEAAKLRAMMPNVPFLVPGYGAQGGAGIDVMPCFDGAGQGALINSSRGIIFAFETEKTHDFAGAARRATLAMRQDLIDAFKQTGKLPVGWD